MITIEYYYITKDNCYLLLKMIAIFTIIINDY